MKKTKKATSKNIKKTTSATKKTVDKNPSKSKKTVNSNAKTVVAKKNPTNSTSKNQYQTDKKPQKILTKNKSTNSKNLALTDTEFLDTQTTNNKKTSSKKHNSNNKTDKGNNFTINSFVVYPSHGVGKIIDIENTQVMQQIVSCYLIYFDREKLTIKIPIKNADKFGIRKLASKSQMDEVFAILRSGVKKMKGMWSRRAQEYETKINSGDIVMLAEVIRDLTRDIEDSERSYSERIIYETAIFRLACEYSAIYNIPIEDAKNKVTITAKDKLESESKSSSKDDDFDDFDNISKSALSGDEEEEEEEDEEEEEEDDFNYEYNEDAEEDEDFEDDEKPSKRKK